ncbi:cell wall-active antibiotics response protein LiaF [Schleiferilactobacillus shenzhenensis]|uniref:cell wall-active antibiotics response protein LiaF n=1 Tax=Schleiferilactobacillus shenzhenensis TaxID=1231337 RepID=UPI0003FBB5B8|nr:cell wall-active antibiotics response protein LiaF [Schleiferilactobacillus shenzhenensis]
MRVLWWIIALLDIAAVAFLGWQIVTEPIALILVVIGTLLVVGGHRRHETARDSSRIFGCIFIAIGITMNAAFWIFFLITLLAVLLFLGTMGGGLHKWVPWRKKEYVHFQTTAPGKKPAVQRSPWLGGATIGETSFPWDDINFVSLYGDTIIDLGNTLLPEDQDNTIMIRKGFGRTRILVPVGVAVTLDHSAVAGSVQFLDQHYQLQNERVQLHTADNGHPQRTIKIVTSTLFGDLEVRYV